MRVIVPLWIALLTAVSLAPDHLKADMGIKGAFHLPAHFLVFAITGVIFCWKSASLQSKLGCAFAGCSFALALELLEALPFHHRVEWYDVYTGWLGVAFGLAILGILEEQKRPLHS